MTGGIDIHGHSRIRGGGLKIDQHLLVRDGGIRAVSRSQDRAALSILSLGSASRRPVVDIQAPNLHDQGAILLRVSGNHRTALEVFANTGVAMAGKISIGA